MRAILQAGIYNVQKNADLTDQSIAFSSIAAMHLGLVNFMCREFGMDSTAATILIGMLGGVQGFAFSPKLLNQMFGQQVNQDQEPDQNDRAKWVKKALLATTTALAAVGTSMLMEYVVNITKDTADGLEPYPAVNLSPYIAAAIGGAVISTILGAVLDN